MNAVGRELVPVVTVPVRRAGRQWIVEAPSDGVWTQGSSLAEARERSHAAIALARDIALDQIVVNVRVDAPELDALSEARERERAALAAAVVRLRSQGVSWPETARAVQVSERTARSIAEAASGAAR